MKFIATFAASALLFASAASALDHNEVLGNLGQFHGYVIPVFVNQEVADVLITVVLASMFAYLINHFHTKKDLVDTKHPLRTALHFAGGLLLLDVILYIVKFAKSSETHKEQRDVAPIKVTKKVEHTNQ